jgi:hypothetical protein
VKEEEKSALGSFTLLNIEEKDDDGDDDDK